MASQTLSDKAKRGERTKKVRVWRGVDKVGVGDERGSYTHDGPVERGDEDLTVRVEGLRYVEVIRRKGLQRLAVLLFLRTFVLAGD